MARLYISQNRVDSWSAENRIEISGDTMTLVEHGRAFIIQPAVRFLGVSGAGEDAGEDPHDLVGKVKNLEELAELGADHMASSVIYDETAYDVENGFIGTPLPRGAKPGTVSGEG